MNAPRPRQVTPNTHKHLSLQVAARLPGLAEYDPELHKLLTDYVTSLRFENSRHRNQLRLTEARLAEVQQKGHPE